MMARPWAKATAVIPLTAEPQPTTAAAPAPMNTNEKVPMNSARSLGAIRLDIVDSTDEIELLGAIRSAPRYDTLVGGGRRRRRAPPAYEASRPTPQRSSAV